MRRRKALLALGVIALSMPITAVAQTQARVWRIGILATRARPKSMQSDPYGTIPKALHDLGYIEGKNVMYEWRFAAGDYALLPALAAELVQLKVDLIFAVSGPATRAAQKTTQTIPIVMGTSYDPVRSGFVKSLSHPGGNVTGLSSMNEELVAKHLELLIAIVPKLSRAAVLLNFGNPGHRATLKSIEAESSTRNISVLPFDSRTPEDIRRSFAAMKERHVEGLIVGRDPLILQQHDEIVALAAAARIPAIYPNEEYAGESGLISYGSNSADHYRRAAVLVDRILKGARPADLPVEQPTKFTLKINVRSARALGITIPPSVLLRADEVIQ